MLRCAVTIGLEDRHGRFLIVKRPETKTEFPGFWSLPTVSLDCADQAPPSREALDIIIQKTFPDLGVDITRDLRHSCIRQRREYTLLMHLVCLTTDVTSSSVLALYEEVSFLPFDRVLSITEAKFGCCLSMLALYLISIGKLSSAVQYLELSPDHVGRNLNSLTDTELWSLSAAANYQLMSKENAGPAKDIRSIAADRYIHQCLGKYTAFGKKVVDLGCGDGRFVHDLRRKGVEAYGLDIEVNPAGPASSYIKHGDIFDAPQIFDLHFDILVLNLVVQWIGDISRLLSVLGKISATGALVIVTFVPAEFSKNGDWIRSGGSWGWTIRAPLRREPFITMINHTIGPVRLYPRLIPEYLNSFAHAGMICDDIQYIFLDSFTTLYEQRKLLDAMPDLSRHIAIPAFVGCTFKSHPH